MVGLRRLARSGFAELPKIKGSRFIGGVHPVTTEEQARAFLSAARAKHPKATHHCLAFRCGAAARANDDGEPSGTAGRPILAQLDAAGVGDAAAVVVRYYGGRKLGAGGLARAYGAAARAALAAGELGGTLVLGAGRDATGELGGGSERHSWLHVELEHRQVHALRAAVQRASAAAAAAADVDGDGGGDADADGGGDGGDVAMAGVRIEAIDFGQCVTAILSVPAESIGGVRSLLLGAFKALRVAETAAPAAAASVADTGSDAEACAAITFDI